MVEILLRMLGGATAGLALVLLVRRPARRAFGAGPAFTLWLLPVVLALAPLWPPQLAPQAMVILPGMTITPHAAASAPAAGFDWATALLVTWLVGAALGSLRLAWHYLRLRAATRRPPAELLTAACAALPDLDARRVRVHPDGPALLWALPRSLVLLPHDFAGRFTSTEARALVLRHELTHARRGDAWWCLAMEVASALLWFHPLAWWARPRFRLDQELACDAASLRGSPRNGADYARTLLDSVAVQPAAALIPWLAEPQLKERIAMLSRNPPGALRRRAGFTVVAAVLAGGLYVAGGQVSALAASPTDASAPSVDVTWKNEHPPHYPVEAIQKGEQGMVVLDVTVDAQGNVANVAVDHAGTTAPATLQGAALQAAKAWRYAPGHKHGEAVGGVVRVPVYFSLTGVGADANHSLSLPSVDVQHKNRNPPAYPAEALKRREQGNVVLDISVDAAGKVTGVQVDKNGTDAPAELQTAAIAAAWQWKFNPGRRDGKPVAGMVQVPVKFSLNNNYSSDGTSEPCPEGNIFDVAATKCIPDAPHFIPPAPAH